MIHKKEIIEILRDYKKEFAEQYGISEIGVFGSVARDEIGEDSDIDVVVRISKPDLFLLVGIKNDLEERLHRSVDIVTYRENMNQFLKNKIDKDALYVRMSKQSFILVREKSLNCMRQYKKLYRIWKLNKEGNGLLCRIYGLDLR